MTLAARQRNDLCDLFEELGPLAPTLCGTWKTQDLAAHLWIREHKPAALPGIGVERFADRTERIQMHTLHIKGFAEIVQELRTPGWMMWALDPFVNAAEFTIHHMDVLKPQGRALVLTREEQARLWRFVTMLSRKVDFDGRFVLEWSSGSVSRGSGDRTVHVLGHPSEILYLLSGRTEDADVTIVGEPDAVADLKEGVGVL